MISKDSPITREYIKKMYYATHDRNFILHTLYAIEDEKNMPRIIEYLDTHKESSKTDIDIEILKAVGILKEDFGG